MRDGVSSSAAPAKPHGLFTGGAIRRDYVLTFATEFVVLACSILVFRFAAVYWGTSGFGEYVLARRTLSMLELPLLLGMGLAVTRYTALARGRHEPGGHTGSYFASALVLVGVSGAIAALSLLLFSRPLGFLLFGSEEYRGLARALAVAVPGTLLHTLAYAEFRGRVAMVPANLLQGLNRGLAPLVVFAVPGLTVEEALTLTGVIWFTAALATIVSIVRRQPPVSWTWVRLRARAAELVRYGAPRVPGEVALAVLLALPATLAAHYGGVEHAGFVGLGVSVVSLAGSLFSPAGRIILPTAAALFSSGAHEVLRRDALRLWGLALAGSTILLLGFELWGPSALAWYLGPEFTRAAAVLRAVAVAMVPYVMYLVLRDLLDAVHVQALNAKNLIVALASFVVLAVGARSVVAVPVAFATGMVVLGLLSTRDAFRLLGMARRSPA